MFKNLHLLIFETDPKLIGEMRLITAILDNPEYPLKENELLYVNNIFEEIAKVYEHNPEAEESKREREDIDCFKFLVDIPSVMWDQGLAAAMHWKKALEDQRELQELRLFNIVETAACIPHMGEGVEKYVQDFKHRMFSFIQEADIKSMEELNRPLNFPPIAMRNLKPMSMDIQRGV